MLLLRIAGFHRTLDERVWCGAAAGVARRLAGRSVLRLRAHGADRCTATRWEASARERCGQRQGMARHERQQTHSRLELPQHWRSEAANYTSSALRDSTFIQGPRTVKSRLLSSLVFCAEEGLPVRCEVHKVYRVHSSAGDRILGKALSGMSAHLFFAWK